MSPSHGNRIRFLALAGWAAALTASLCAAQDNEIALTLGRIDGLDRPAGTTPVNIGGGTAFQANYGRTFWQRPAFALQFEVHFLANPQRVIDSTSLAATRDVATLYVTPGVRLKLGPTRRVSPWFSVGGGYAAYEQSTETLGGLPNPAPRLLNRGAVQMGAGIDVKVWKWFGLRGEIRDFYTGSPAFNVRIEGGQHNLVAGGGLLFTF